VAGYHGAATHAKEVSMDPWAQRRYEAVCKAVLPKCPVETHPIIKALLKHRDKLSDSYSPLWGEAEGDAEALTDIAQEILALEKA
jgi:hypothetical protein